MKLNEVVDTRPLLIMPVGPSGSGKSTLYRKLVTKNPGLRSFSLDTLRHEFYDPKDYAKAWQMSVEDKEFSNKANQRFKEMVEQGSDLFVDNTNLTPKRRKFYLDLARKHGYKTIAYVLQGADLKTLIARQETRGDKKVPEEAVRQQYMSMVRPVSGEFDEVRFVD